MNPGKKWSGQSLLEFALLIPLLFLLVMGLFDIGRAIFYYSVLNTAVREGTRFAIVQPYCGFLSDPTNCTGSTLDTYPLDCTNALSQANINICNQISNNMFNIGDLSRSVTTINHQFNSSDNLVVQISIEFLFNPITPGLGLIGNLPMRVNSQMIMTPISIP